MSTVPYHLESDPDFSLGFVTPDADRFAERLTQFDSSVRVVPCRVTIDRPVYLAYTWSPPQESSNEDIPDHPFVHTMLRAFAGVVDGRRDRGDTVRGNKQASLDEIPDILTSRIDWRQSVPQVGGQLLSNLILTHALPNANHRTSLSMLVVYLNSVGVDVTPDGLIDNDVDTFIAESKRLLTVRRNATKFRILSENGGTGVVRKGDVEIPFSEYDVTVSDPYSEYARRHEQHCVQFVERVVGPNASDRVDPGLSTFLDRLQSRS